MVNPKTIQPKSGLFPTPPLAVARHPGVLLGARELRRWIDTLPLANPPKAGQMLLQQLRLLVRDPQPGPRLGGLLELYDAPLQELLAVVYERLQNNPESAVPLDQLEHLLLELLTELTYGQLRMANDQLNMIKPAAAETLFRAGSLLDNAQHLERLHYRRPTLQSWQLLLQIFLLADRQQMAQQPIEAPLRRAEEPGSVQGLFFRALVISLCDPHHHQPRQLMDWYQWAGQHTDLLELAILPQGALAIPVDIGGTLTPLAAARLGKPGPDTRYLATDRFMQLLQEDDDAPQGLHRALSDLITGRKAPEQRQTERQPRSHPYRLVYGLHNIHRRLSEIVHGSAPNGPGGTPQACVQVNQSRSGAAFQLHGPLNPPLTVGESVLAEADASPENGSPVGFVAQIRRLVSGDDHQIEIGVEKIRGRLIPVQIIGAAAERARGDKHALLLHATETGKYTLIAPRSVYRDGDLIAAETPNTRYNMRMRRLGSVTLRTAYIDVEIADD